MQTSLVHAQDSQKSPSLTPNRRINDLRRPFRRDNSQDVFETPILVRPAATQRSASVPNVRNDPGGCLNRLFIWACTKLFGRTAH